MPDQPITFWPDNDDRSVVAEMLADPHSHQWKECDSYVAKLIRRIQDPFLSHLEEDVKQEAMAAVHRNLPGFRFDCKLTTWLYNIARSKVIDLQRKHKQPLLQESFLKESPAESSEEEIQVFKANPSSSPDEITITGELLEEVKAAIQKYTQLHRNPLRNMQILRMVLYEDQTCEEVAWILGLKPALVSYVVRDARKFLKEKFPDRPWH